LKHPIRINDHGRPVELDYDSFVAYHGGGALTGAAIAYRAMGLAGRLLSASRPWDRETLSVVTTHKGPGVRDGIEYVTRCVTRGSFEVRPDPALKTSCAAEEAFRFTVSDGERMAQIALRPGVVDRRFFDAVRRCDAGHEEARAELEALKVSVAAEVMALDDAQLFSARLAPAGAIAA
jgi:hypothetical protein